MNVVAPHEKAPPAGAAFRLVDGDLTLVGVSLDVRRLLGEGSRATGRPFPI